MTAAAGSLAQRKSDQENHRDARIDMPEVVVRAQFTSIFRPNLTCTAELDEKYLIGRLVAAPFFEVLLASRLFAWL